MNSRSLNNAKPGDMFKIVAEYRNTGKRTIFRSPLTKEEVIAFNPSSLDKKTFRYFRVVILFRSAK